MNIVVNQTTGLCRVPANPSYVIVAVGEMFIAVPRLPDARLERWTGAGADPFRPATAPEIASYDTAQVALADADAGAQFDGAKMLKAKGISDLAFRLGKAPGALTAGEIAAERTRIVNIYKAL